MPSSDASAGRAALLLIDVVNSLDFPGGEALARGTEALAPRLAALKRRARAAGIPVVYVNDNFGAWHLAFRDLVEDVKRRSAPGRALLEAVPPELGQDYFVLKPMHSGFFCTSLEALLRRLAARTLILAGLAGDICVLHTAADAHMRGFGLFVPADCIASEREAGQRYALEHMRRVLDADVRPAHALRLRAHPGGGRVEVEEDACFTT